MSDILRTILVLCLVTMIPGLELRASIPLGIFGGERVAVMIPWPVVTLICTIANILIGMAFFSLLHPIIRALRHIRWMDSLLERFLTRAQRKLLPYVEKYGFWGLAVFIGIPLPLTGAITGAAGAYVLGMRHRQFFLANAIGVCIAAFLVTLLCLLLLAGWNIPGVRLFLKSNL